MQRLHNITIQSDWDRRCESGRCESAALLRPDHSYFGRELPPSILFHQLSLQMRDFALEESKHERTTHDPGSFRVSTIRILERFLFQ
ncbi:hypothetical protein [Rubritalea tangerina]|uniref:hypothetical protein n=1 Tax=Rubritalea tangerina TaxID=430798 RepID=UPI00360F1054